MAVSCYHLFVFVLLVSLFFQSLDTFAHLNLGSYVTALYDVPEKSLGYFLHNVILTTSLNCVGTVLPWCV